jgi:hypothetical protein
MKNNEDLYYSKKNSVNFIDYSKDLVCIANVNGMFTATCLLGIDIQKQN